VEVGITTPQILFLRQTHLIRLLSALVVWLAELLVAALAQMADHLHLTE
jgi:hypothetical protein